MIAVFELTETCQELVGGVLGGLGVVWRGAGRVGRSFREAFKMEKVPVRIIFRIAVWCALERAD